MNSYSKKAVHKVVDMFMEIVCEQEDELRVLKANRPTPHFDVCQRELNSRMRQIHKLLELANRVEHVDSDDIFAIFGGRDVH